MAGPAGGRRPEGPPAGPGEGLLVRGDNLEVMEALGSAWGPCFQLIYSDPPFFSGKDYRANPGPPRRARGFRDDWPAGLGEYLGWLSVRLAAMRDLLAESGSLMVHLDSHALHYVKVELDRIFGRNRFLNEIIWHYTGGGRSRSYFSRKHDSILWYRKGRRWTFHIDAVRVPYRRTSGYARSGIVSSRGKRYLPHPRGTPVDDVWDIPMVNPLSPERTGYPTQKPEILLERILRGCSSPGDLVGDMFCGSGTTGVVARRLGRRWVLCDDSSHAVSVARRRIAALGGGRPARVSGGRFGRAVFRFPCPSSRLAEDRREGGLERPGGRRPLPPH